jgi:hypothetical protein
LDHVLVILLLDGAKLRKNERNAKGKLQKDCADAQQEYGEDDTTHFLIIIKSWHKGSKYSWIFRIFAH